MLRKKGKKKESRFSKPDMYGSRTGAFLWFTRFWSQHYCTFVLMPETLNFIYRFQFLSGLMVHKFDSLKKVGLNWDEDLS